MYGGRETKLPAFTTSVKYGINGESHCGCCKWSNVPINVDIWTCVSKSGSGLCVLGLLDQLSGDRGSTVVKVLCYKSEGR